MNTSDMIDAIENLENGKKIGSIDSEAVVKYFYDQLCVSGKSKISRKVKLLYLNNIIKFIDIIFSTNVYYIMNKDEVINYLLSNEQSFTNYGVEQAYQSLKVSSEEMLISIMKSNDSIEEIKRDTCVINAMDDESVNLQYLVKSGIDRKRKHK